MNGFMAAVARYVDERRVQAFIDHLVSDFARAFSGSECPAILSAKQTSSKIRQAEGGPVTVSIPDLAILIGARLNRCSRRLKLTVGGQIVLRDDGILSLKADLEDFVDQKLVESDWVEQLHG
jgi:hypothetical protein